MLAGRDGDGRGTDFSCGPQLAGIDIVDPRRADRETSLDTVATGRHGNGEGSGVGDDPVVIRTGLGMEN